MKMTAHLIGFWFIASAMLMGSPAYSQQAPETTGQTADNPAPLVVVDNAYRIGAEDILEISVWKEEGLKKEVLVRPDGGLSFPLAGDLHAAGKTTEQLQHEISQKLEKYIPDPVVSVGLLKVGANKIYVIGKVNKPGDYVAGRYLDVLQALSMAGGLTPFAAENDIKVVRREHGEEVALPFQYSQVKKGKRLDQNILLKGGDVVVVP